MSGEIKVRNPTERLSFSFSKNAKYRIPQRAIVQELCESRGGRPGLSVLTSLMVSLEVKQY